MPLVTCHQERFSDFRPAPKIKRARRLNRFRKTIWNQRHLIVWATPSHKLSFFPPFYFSPEIPLPDVAISMSKSGLKCLSTTPA